VQFDKTNGSQDEEENLDDVGGTQLVDAMKNMDIGDIRAKQVIDIQDDDKDQVLNSPFKLASDSQVQDHGASSSHQDTSSDQPSSSNQVQVLQPQHVARDHPIDSVIDDIRSGVQTRSRLAMFCKHNNFTRNDVWELVERPNDYNVIGTKWVFKNKQDQDGIV
jgi:hypothetical protein